MHPHSDHIAPPEHPGASVSGADTAVIRAEGLSKRFDGDDVVRDLDMAIEPGTIVGLIGPSGCGKTTTVRLLTGLLEPSRGEATVDGRPAASMSASERRRIGYLPQIPALFDDLSLWENLSFHASMYGLPLRRKRRLRALLDWVELSGDRRKLVRNVSGGMQRRLALAATFVHDPWIVFLDEPTAGIDPILREKLWEQFRSIRDEGRTLVVTTQYVGEASYCDLVGLLSDGELLMLDTPANLRRAAFGGEVVDIVAREPVGADAVAAIGRLPFVVGDVDRLAPDAVRIVVEDAEHALAELTTCLSSLGIDVLQADEHVVDYDEAFVRVVERHRTLDRTADPADAADTADEPPRRSERATATLPPPEPRRVGA
jgi:ABC-2 type transport system ATP-binding protein